jgi:hypothetical protein
MMAKMKLPERAPPLGLVAVLLLIALASLGVVYGLWSKTLTIEGTVNTGRLHARWDGVICSEFHDWPWPPEGTGEVLGKDVGSTDAYIDPNDNNTMHLVIENGYPSYSVDCEVEYVNDGTIPWIIRGTTILPLSPNLHNCVLTGNQTKTLTCDELTVILVDGVGSQIDPGDGVASSVRVHVEQPAEQNAEYLFAIQICVGQWNEPVTFGQCVAAAPTVTPPPPPP